MDLSQKGFMTHGHEYWLNMLTRMYPSLSIAPKGIASENTVLGCNNAALETKDWSSKCHKRKPTLTGHKLIFR